MNSVMLDTSIIRPRLRSNNFLPSDTIAVFLTGSIVRGWGNATSDLDVHVVVKGQPASTAGEASYVALEPNYLQSERTFVDGRRWDIEYWSLDQVDQLLHKVSWAAYEGLDPLWSTLTVPELSLLERLPYALAADDGSWLAATQQRLSDSAHAVILSGISLRESDGFVEDAAGCLAAGDIHSAVLAAQLAFGHAVDALQAVHGQFGSKWPKWRARRMRLVNSPVLSFDQYWSTATMASFDEENPRAWVEETLATCQRISSGLQI